MKIESMMFFVPVIFTFGLIIGFSYEQNLIQKQAIQNHCATWTYDTEGNCVFKWEKSESHVDLIKFHLLRNEAVRRGFARWEVDSYGNVEFVWKGDMPSKIENIEIIK